MVKGIIFALAACFIWGLIFVIPQFMGAFSSIEVALGRYSVYGLISICVLIRSKVIGRTFRYPFSMWVKASYFSLMSTFAYYIPVVLALRYSSPAICALILGTSPIVVAFYGSWKLEEGSIKSLVIPSLFILIGLIVINGPHLTTGDPIMYSLGLFGSLIGLGTWSWCMIANSQLMRGDNPISSTDWSTMVGVCALFWTFLMIGILALFFDHELQWEHYSIHNPAFLNFLIGAGVLGVLCSWLGASLWNKACSTLSTSLVGQLSIFETIFGVLFVYLIAQEFPPQMECMGIALLLVGVIFGIRISAKASLKKLPL